MAKKTGLKTLYVCSACGEEAMQWAGKCESCGAWNTLTQVTVSAAAKPLVGGYSGQAVGDRVSLASVVMEDRKRVPSGVSEMDRVLGGGFVPGSVILLGGDPGVGKSTLMLQIAARLAEQPGGVLYVSGEESAHQIALRADRLGLRVPGVTILNTTNVQEVAAAFAEHPALVVIDSIQTMADPDLSSTPGSMVQVRESALRLQHAAKQHHVPTLLVGHITKEGTVAGPRTLEHLVDAVLYLEGDPMHALRLLRSAKNRFGDASEVGLFTMGEEGLVVVDNPGDFLLSERTKAAGSILSCVLEGTRPMLVEVQALVSPTVFGNPRRTGSGFDTNRLHLLLAVLQQRAGCDLSSYDVYINVVGGVHSKDPGLDAAVCVAVASARSGVVLGEHDVVVGEVGLGGEVRSVRQGERRKKELERLGYTLKTARSVRQLIS